MGAAGLYDAPELLRFFGQGLAQAIQGGDELLFYLRQGGQVDRRGDDVVGGLAQVDVVVGVDELGGALAAQQLRSAVGDDLIGVHVGGSAGAGLEDIDDELIVQLTVGHLARGLPDRRGDLGVQEAQVGVDAGGGPLDQAQNADEGAAEAEAAYGEVADGALGGGAVVGVRRDLHGAHGVALSTALSARCHGHIPLPA